MKALQRFFLRLLGRTLTGYFNVGLLIAFILQKILTVVCDHGIKVSETVIKIKHKHNDI